MPCEECRELNTHSFRTPDDLIHALRLAAEEVDRGVLARMDARERRHELREPGSAEDEALSSALASGAMPGAVTYRFRCALCGDRFTLEADTAQGSGAWTREDATAARP